MIEVKEEVTKTEEQSVAADAELAPENVEVATKKREVKLFTTGNIAVIAILTAISFLLYALPFLKFPLSFMFPMWLEIQISDLPALLGGFALGPTAGCLIIVLKCCLKMPMTSTACVGELADILVGIAFVLPSSLIYKLNKSRKSAIVGMSIGAVCAVAFSVLANWLILIPFYATAMFGDGNYSVGLAKIVGIVSALYSNVTVDNFYAYYLPLAVVPFNLLRCAICAVLTYFTYKPLSKALHWEIKIKKHAKQEVEATAASLEADIAAEQPVANEADESALNDAEGLATETENNESE